MDRSSHEVAMVYAVIFHGRNFADFTLTLLFVKYLPSNFTLSGYGKENKITKILSKVAIHEI